MHIRSVLALSLAAAVAACGDAPFSPSVASLADARASASATTSFTVIANAAITCTDGTIIGDVATLQAPPTGAFTQTNCTFTGTAHIGDAAGVQAYNAFVATYDAMTPDADVSCTLLTGTLANVSLSPGTYCFDAAAALTGTLTLDGPSNGTWLFLVGTSGTGALTGTNFSVELANGARACNVTWWVAEAVTMTTSNFVGNILAGAAITMTGGTTTGNLWSKAGVTITGTYVVGCETTNRPGARTNDPGCNQGVGNGPEGCDPGKSNHRRTSNDELGGVPGNPGRKGGR